MGDEDKTQLEQEYNQEAQNFLLWLNERLAQRNLHADTLYNAFSDGVNLIHVLEIISGGQVGRYTKNPRFAGQKIENIRIAFSFIEKRWGLKIWGISAKEIMDGNPKHVMSLMFLLTNKVYRIATGSSGIPSPSANDEAGRSFSLRMASPPSSFPLIRPFSSITTSRSSTDYDHKSGEFYKNQAVVVSNPQEIRTGFTLHLPSSPRSESDDNLSIDRYSNDNSIDDSEGSFNEDTKKEDSDDKDFFPNKGIPSVKSDSQIDYNKRYSGNSFSVNSDSSNYYVNTSQINSTITTTVISSESTNMSNSDSSVCPSESKILETISPKIHSTQPEEVESEAQSSPEPNSSEIISDSMTNSTSSEIAPEPEPKISELKIPPSKATPELELSQLSGIIEEPLKITQTSNYNKETVEFPELPKTPTITNTELQQEKPMPKNGIDSLSDGNSLQDLVNDLTKQIIEQKEQLEQQEKMRNIITVQDLVDDLTKQLVDQSDEEKNPITRSPDKLTVQPSEVDAIPMGIPTISDVPDVEGSSSVRKSPKGQKSRETLTPDGGRKQKHASPRKIPKEEKNTETATERLSQDNARESFSQERSSHELSPRDCSPGRSPRPVQKEEEKSNEISISHVRQSSLPTESVKQLYHRRKVSEGDSIHEATEPLESSRKKTRRRSGAKAQSIEIRNSEEFSASISAAGTTNSGPTTPKPERVSSKKASFIIGKLGRENSTTEPILDLQSLNSIGADDKRGSSKVSTPKQKRPAKVIDEMLRFELLQRFEGKHKTLARLQAYVRARPYRGLIRKMKKERQESLIKEISNDKTKSDGISRLQAAIRSKSARFKAPPPLKRLRARHKIALEILNTEDTYLHGLHCLNDIFLQNLRSLPPDVLPPTTLKSIFSNIEVIYKYNTLIQNKVKSRVEKWFTEGMMMGDVFLKFADFLKVYTSYVNNYNQAFKNLTELYRDNPAVREALEKSRSHPHTQGAELQNFLITPIQRIPRYVLLLQDLLRNTEKSEKDHDMLVQAVKKVQVVADYVNEKKREAENLHAVYEIANHIVGYNKEQLGELALPSRHYVRQGLLGVVEDISGITDSDIERLSPSQFKDRYIFLFNDFLLNTKHSPTGIIGKLITGGTQIAGKVKDVFRRLESEIVADDEGGYTLDDLIAQPALQFQFRNSVSLDNTEVMVVEEGNSLTSSSTTGKYCFGIREIDSGKFKIIFSATSKKMKLNFVKEIDDALGNILKAVRTRCEYDSAQAELENIMEREYIKGELHKKTKTGDWKTIYGALVGTQLRLYPSSESEVIGETPKKTVPVINSNITLVPTISDPVRTFCFTVQNSQKTYTFNVPTLSLSVQWVNALRLSIRKHLDLIRDKHKPPLPVPHLRSGSISTSTTSMGGSVSKSFDRKIRGSPVRVLTNSRREISGSEKEEDTHSVKDTEETEEGTATTTFDLENSAERSDEETQAAEEEEADDDEENDNKDNKEEDKKTHKRISSVLKLRSSTVKSDKKEKSDKAEKSEGEKSKLLVKLKKGPRRKGTLTKDPRAKELANQHKKGSVYFMAGNNSDNLWKKCTANMKEKYITITKNKKEEIEINILQFTQPVQVPEIAETTNGNSSLYFINFVVDSNVAKFGSESKDDLIDWIEKINKSIEICTLFGTPRPKKNKPKE